MGTLIPDSGTDEASPGDEALNEEALRSLAGAVLDAAANAQLGVSVTLLDPLQRIYANEALARMFGYTPEELLKLPTLFSYTPAGEAKIKAMEARRHRGETVPVFVDTEIVHRDGTHVQIEIAYSFVRLRGQLGAVAFVRDIRERVRTESALQRSESMFRKLIETAPEAVVVTRENLFIYANPNFAALLGYERFDEIAARGVLDFVHPDDRDDVISRRPSEPFLEFSPPELESGGAGPVRGQPSPTDEFRLLKNDGEVISVERTWIYIDFEGQPAALNFIRDVTRRKQEQAKLIQTDRMATVGTLAAGVAHELNNPLAYMMLHLSLLEKTLGELLPAHDFSRVKERLATVQHGAERMAGIVRDLRSLCRPDAPTLHPVVVHEVLDSAVNIALNELKGRARVVRDYAATPSLLADGARLGQVFLNLLLNAAQAIPEGNPDDNEVRISLYRQGSERVCVAVSDSGQGIPSALLSKIFEPFFTTKPVGVGMGLGLSISQNIVASLSGELTVESQEGKGTTFRVLLPVGRELKAPGSAAGPARTAPASASLVRVLIIDDEPALAAALGACLSPEFAVTVMERGEHALSLLAQGEHFDAILCDVLMPGMGGIEVYEQLERKHPDLLRRIVFMTGAASMPRVAQFLARMSNPHLDKPIDVELMRRTLQAIAALP
jgi:PAS domain S-box-containing protein